MAGGWQPGWLWRSNVSQCICKRHLALAAILWRVGVWRHRGVCGVMARWLSGGLGIWRLINAASSAAV